MSSPPHPCLAISADPDNVDHLAWRVHALGANGIEIRDRDTLTPGAAGRSLLLAGFDDGAARDAARDALASGAGNTEVRSLDVTDDGWSTRWREFFRPVVLERLQVITPWMAPPRADRLTLVVDPGQAFGTGGHPTTRLVLSLLERRAFGAGLPERVLDVGCGSGVLAIAAALLGAGSAHGIDIDPQAVHSANENALANRVADRVSCTARTPDDLSGTWPLVLANIELTAFVRLAPAIAARVAPAGSLLVSGLLEDQAEACRSLFPDFDVVGRLTLDGWLALALVRT
jgi:ribosomal protein L11 methyltransferase